MNRYRDSQTGRYVHSPANRTKHLLAELYRLFDYFNKKYAEGKLPEVVITVQNKGRSSALGWFGDNFWKDKITSSTVAEINMSAEHISRGREACIETLLHEMAHLWNAAVANVKDCSGSQYHNKHFKTAAEQFGLVVKKHNTRGWASTSLGEDAYNCIKNLDIDDSIFTGLQRRRISRPSTKYISLVADPDVADVIESIKTKLPGGCSQKKIVRLALEQFEMSL